MQFLPLKIKREITTLSRRLDIIFFCLLVVIHTVLQIAYQIQLGPEVMYFTRLYGISGCILLIISSSNEKYKTCRYGDFSYNHRS